MRQLIHLSMSPASRVARLALGEKRVPYTLSAAGDALAHLPVLVEEEGYAVTGLWAIFDHVEANYPEGSLLPEDAAERAEALRLFDWLMSTFNDTITKRVVWEKAAQSQTGAPERRAPSLENLRKGRDALVEGLDMLGALAEERGYLAGREATLADLALAAQISALDYFGEIPWPEHPAAQEWYLRMKSRPSFRPLLADRIPGQPPVNHYAELDF